MGLFASRPEEPTEWGGIPSDPLERSATDHLPQNVEFDALGLVTGAAVSSVAIPLPAPGQESSPTTVPDGEGNADEETSPTTPPDREADANEEPS